MQKILILLDKRNTVGSVQNIIISTISNPKTSENTAVLFPKYAAKLTHVQLCCVRLGGRPSSIFSCGASYLL